MIRSQGESDSKKQKSAEIMERVIQGKVNKRLAEIALLEQVHSDIL